MRLELMGLVSTKLEYLLGLGDNVPVELKDETNNIRKITNRCSVDGSVDKTKKEEFIEEVAYTWFNRLIALRFMDVNEITDESVISTLEGQTLPQLFNSAKGGEIDDALKLDRKKFYDIIDGKIPSNNPDNEAYKMLFIATCNNYSKLMPTMFEKISDYTELLLPEDMLSPNSIRAKVVESMSEEDCQDIEVIGWLYQFYISEKKDDVFAMLKKNKKITPSNIPAATQLFTPHWIVKYMVENSLGKLWMLNNPNSTLKESMKYYIENKEETTTFIKVTSPEEITFLDPCCGSGHTLTYAFDLLTKIYEEEGYNKSEIPSLILENNLFGCDIDKRASILANFALTMKARQYHKRFFKKDVKPNIVELEDYNSDEFAGIKNFGSLLVPHKIESFDDGLLGQTTREYKIQKKILSSEFHCVVTNPPYMGGKGMNKSLSEFVKARYPDSKSDLFAVFIERGLELTKDGGFMAMITMQSWMFISSYDKFRKSLLSKHQLVNMCHMGAGAFDYINAFNVLSTAFVISPNNKIEKFKSTFIDLTKQYDTNSKETEFFNTTPIKVEQDIFLKINGYHLLYQISMKAIDILINSTALRDIVKPNQGLATGDNDRFVKQWSEVNFKDIGFHFSTRDSAMQSKLKWFPYNKSGNFRRWYGNQESLVNWENDGYDIRKDKLDKLKKGLCLLSNSQPKNTQHYFKRGLTWSLFGFDNFGIRYTPDGFLFDVGGSSAFPQDKDILFLLSYLSGKIAFFYLSKINPTVNFQNGDLAKLPIIFPKSDVIKQQIETLAQQNIDISKEEWDSRETSWDFIKNELIKHKSDSKIETAYTNYCNYWKEKHNILHQNEEELNRLFIDIYELQDELTADVKLKYITLLKNEAKIIDNELVFQADEIMKQFISYSVGVMFGRYSLDSDGLLIANMGQEVPTDTSFEIDDDNVIPVLEDDYFSDDIASRFVTFVKTVFGEEDLNENILFIEDSLGMSIRKYFVKGFYEDHLKRYKKRPIYWMVSSPKKSFNALFYMHRYESDIFARVQNSYLREYITKLEASKQTLHVVSEDESNSATERRKATKEIDNITKKVDEIIKYDRDHLTAFAQGKVEIDLDDGVKVNYCKFKGVLYPITGLCK